ncbi:MAG: hypothetical protein GY774_07570 [Planctomycetes bacterium]|nr:hypothetical protein [Planctomycetota bacterium]
MSTRTGIFLHFTLLDPNDPHEGADLHVKKESISTHSFDKSYPLLDTQMIQVLTLELNGKAIDVHCDEMYFEREDAQHVGIVFPEGKELGQPVFGPLIITGADGKDSPFSESEISEMVLNGELTPLIGATPAQNDDVFNTHTPGGNVLH